MALSKVIIIAMKELDSLFEHANQVEISLRWYYDVGGHQFEQFKELTQNQPTLQSAVAEALQMSHWYGASYLVSMDLVSRSPKTETTQPNPGNSQEVS